MKHYSSWVSKKPWEDINPTVPLQAYDAYGNEDSFGFHLLAQSIFWLSPKLCELDESKMSVSHYSAGNRDRSMGIAGLI